MNGDYSRSKIAMIAFACEPGRGSEPGVGWEWLRTAAESVDVILYTRDDGHGETIKRALADESLCGVEIVEVSTYWDGMMSHPGHLYVRYLLFLMRAQRLLAKRIGSDGITLVHHVTYASDWLPSVRSGSVPLIWGPVGGATKTPRELRSYLSRSAKFRDILRSTISDRFRRTFAKRTIRNARLCLALNSENAAVLTRLGARKVIVAPNAIVEDADPPVRDSEASANENFTAIYAGRILEWKGIAIALEAFEQRNGGKWVLKIYGEGVDRKKLEAQSVELGLSGVVMFMGSVQRQNLFDSMLTADAFIFPSLHDSSPWVVAEAAAAGLPVLCFPQGGSRELALENARLIDTYRPAASINEILDSIEAGEGGSPVRIQWDRHRVRELLKWSYSEVTA